MQKKHEHETEHALSSNTDRQRVVENLAWLILIAHRHDQRPANQKSKEAANAKTKSKAKTGHIT